MEMIIGGAYQGKVRYARERFPDVEFLWAGDLTEEDLLHAEGIHGFHAFIRKQMEQGMDVADLAEKLIRQNPELILISDEVGYGVVPVDALDRAYREAVGRVCTKLAAFSSRVTRVALGIGTVIKDD